MLQSSDDGNDSNDNPGMVRTCSKCQLPAQATNGQGKGVSYNADTENGRNIKKSTNRCIVS